MPVEMDREGVIGILPAPCPQINKGSGDSAQLAGVEEGKQLAVGIQLGGSRGAIDGQGHMVPFIVPVIAVHLNSKVIVPERSEERRVGKALVSNVRSRWSQYL